MDGIIAGGLCVVLAIGVFLMIGIVFLLIAISVFCINRWIRYIAIAVAIIAIIYAIVSSVMIERHKK